MAESHVHGTLRIDVKVTVSNQIKKNFKSRPQMKMLYKEKHGYLNQN